MKLTKISNFITIISMNKITTGPIKHHYVPQFYLKRWFNDKGFLYKYSRGCCEPQKICEKGLNNVCQENHLYSMPLLNPERPELAELNFFQTLDANASMIIDKFKEGVVNNLSNVERIDWIKFLKMMMFRRPEMINVEMERISNLECFKGAPKNETRDYTIDALCNSHKEKSLAQDILVSSVWKVYKTQENSFIISDNPYVHLGGMIASYNFSIPLCPNKIFVIHNDFNFLENSCSLEQYRKKHNKIMIDQATRFIFTTDRNDEDFILKHFK